MAEAFLFDQLAEVARQADELGSWKRIHGDAIKVLAGTDRTSAEEMAVGNCVLFSEDTVFLIYRGNHSVEVPYIRTVGTVSSIEECDFAPPKLLRKILHLGLNAPARGDAEQEYADARAEVDRFVRNALAGAPERLEAALKKYEGKISEMSRSDKLPAYDAFAKASEARTAAHNHLEAVRKTAQESATKHQTSEDRLAAAAKVMAAHRAKAAAQNEYAVRKSEYAAAVGLNPCAIVVDPTQSQYFSHRGEISAATRMVAWLREYADDLAAHEDDVAESLAYRVLYTSRMLAVTQCAYAFAQMLATGGLVGHGCETSLRELARAIATGEPPASTEQVEKLKPLFGMDGPEWEAEAAETRRAAQLDELAEKLAELEAKLAELKPLAAGNRASS